MKKYPHKITNYLAPSWSNNRPITKQTLEEETWFTNSLSRTTIISIVLVVIPLYLYKYGLRSDWSNADQIAAVLEGSSMAHGNFLLHHWHLGLDSYWMLDSLIFAICVYFFNANTIIIQIVPTIILAGTMWLGFVIASVILLLCVPYLQRHERTCCHYSNSRLLDIPVQCRDGVSRLPCYNLEIPFMIDTVHRRIREPM